MKAATQANKQADISSIERRGVLITNTGSGWTQFSEGDTCHEDIRPHVRQR
jgi:hypothetical protein